MKKCLCLIACIIAYLGTMPMLAQDKGIRFENLSLNEACAKAKAEGKKVFVDCYTKTCGPCKYMMKNIFPLEECGDYFNPRYVSLTQDMEEGEGPEMGKTYGVGVYPTFLVINPDGTLFCKELGAVTLKSEITFVQKMERAVKRAEMETQYEAGNRDTAFVKNYIAVLKASGDGRLGAVVNEYLAPLSVEELCSKENWLLVQTDINSPEAPVFRKLLSERKTFEEKLGRPEVEGKIISTYRNEFNMCKMMGMDFPSRIADLKTLEADGYKGALALRYCMTLRDIINSKQTSRANEIVGILQELTSKVTDEQECLGVVKELVRFERIANASQREEACSALKFIQKSMTTERNVNEINRTINRLSPNK